MSQKWIRVGAGVLATIIAVDVGLVATGSFDLTPDPNTGLVAGAIPGALTGLLSNLIWTFVLAGTPFGSPFAWPYAIVAAEIGLLAGIFGYYGFFRSRPNTPPERLAAGLVVAIAILGALVFYGILPFYAQGFTFFGDTSGTAPIFIVLAWVIAIGLVVALVALGIQLFRKRDLGVAYIVI